MMKIAAIFFTLLFSFNAFAETYSCSGSLAKYGRPNESEIKTFQRMGSFFLKVSENGKYKFKILYESNDSLVIYQAEQYSWGASLYTTLIHKKNLQFIESYSSFLDIESNNSPQMTGKCIVY